MIIRLRSVSLAISLGATGLCAADQVPIYIPPAVLAQIMRSGEPKVGNLKLPRTGAGTLPKNLPPGFPIDPTKPTLPTPNAVTKKKPSIVDWFNEMVIGRIDLSGRRTLSYHQDSVTGDVDAFNTLNYYGQGDRRVTSTGQMNINGKKVAGVVDFNLTITDDRIQNPEDQRLSATYQNGPTTVALGDINASLVNSNRFARVARSVSGAQLGWRKGRVEAKALRSETRGSARTVTTQGNNSVGPYYLQGGRVRADTLQVRVDGEPQQIGRDFELDTEVGAITFITRVVSPTSTIVATYESTGFNESPGVLSGAGVTYDFGRVGRLGLTAVQQVGRGAVGTAQKVELFQGRGNPAVGYDLDYNPVATSVVLRVNGIIQVPNLDYTFDTKYPRRFYMSRFVDLNETISVTYQPVGIVSVDGDRRTVGLDYLIPLGKTGDRGFIQLNQATGGFIGGTSAQARGVDYEQKEGRWTLRSSFRDIPRDYVTVETRGFDRNERAHEWSAEYDSESFLYNLSGTNSSVYVTDSSNPTGKVARYTTVKGGVQYSDPDGTRWSLNQVRLANHFDDDTKLDTTSLAGRRTFGRVNASLGLQYQTGSAPITENNVTKVGPLSVASVVATADWNAGRGLAFNTRLSYNDIKALDQRGKGYDAALGVGWKPSDTWTFGAQFAQSDSGDLPAVSISSGYGLGYNGGNGFTSGSAGDELLIGASSQKRIALVSEYRASSRVTLSARWQQNNATGDLSSNADNRTYGLGASLDLGQSTYLSSSIDRSNTEYSGTNGRSEATTFSVGLTGSPPGRLTYMVGLTGLISQNTTSATYNQDSLTYDFSLSYRLVNRQRLNASFSQGRSTGYYGQNESYFSISHDYQLYQRVGLRTGYTWRNVSNLDPALSSGSYRANGFNVDLVFDF